MLASKNIIAFEKKLGIAGVDSMLYNSASTISLSLNESNRNFTPCDYTSIVDASTDNNYRKYLIYNLMTKI